MKVSVQNVGSSKKYLHNLTHECTTTAQFGFVQPLMVNERCPKDSVTLRVGQSVFLAPMSKPTFGRLSVKTYSSFVPIQDIWHAYESFLSAQSYRGALATYVPVIVPNIRQVNLLSILLYGSHVHAFETSGLKVDPNGKPVGYNDLVVSNDQLTAYQEYSQYLSDISGWNFNSGSIISNCVPLDLSCPSTVPSPDPGSGIDYEASDFVIFIKANGTTITKDWVCFVNLSSDMRNVRKVLLGSGYQLNFSTSKVSLLPLFAYYKAYFDLFNVARDRTWKETNAFGFMERVEQGNFADFASWSVDPTCIGLFLQFIKDIRLCYYTQDPDYVSAHISAASLPIATQGSNTIASLDSVGTGTQNVQVTSSGRQPMTTAGATNSAANVLTQNRLDILRKLYYRINSATAIGGRIRAFLKAFYGTTEFDEQLTNNIGSQNVPINISMVVNQAQTTTGDLGEYAAKGIADDAGKTFKFECRQQGYVVVLCAFVPQTRYAQAVDPNLSHLTKYDFYTRDFDSLTLLPNAKFNIMGAQESNSPSDIDSGFGNIPNYMEYKVKYNVLNGDMSLGSKRTGYLPFTLDKLLPWRDEVLDSNGCQIYNFPSSLLVANSSWRFIGKNSWLGWFNRIFINSGVNALSTSVPNSFYLEEIDDNFILYNFIDYKVSSFALPVADSWQTSEDTDTFVIEKA